MRGLWVASVGNIDWPSRPELSPEQQKTELIQILDRAAGMRLNTIILQVRPSCDALYQSSIEPWSEYLTGKMGEPPRPFYDPLAFAVMEAHRRGMELHAWFNPFRARHISAKSPATADHVTRRFPQFIRRYGKQLWLDPGEPLVQSHTIRVILDVVKRYDIDGVHIDDYFYPYPEMNAARQPVAFPDDPPWKRYRAGGGKLDRADWRRENVNQFVERLYGEVKSARPWVKVGISPFGIWRDGFPPQVHGFDAYEKLFADSRKWLGNGWLDYFAPQLYWSISAREQSFPVLLKWWSEQNPRRRILTPGIALTRASIWGSREIADQISAVRAENGASGEIFWNARSLMNNPGGAAGAISNLYLRPALVPAISWMNNPPPAQPVLNATRSRDQVTLNWRPGAGEPVWQWVVQRRIRNEWFADVFPKEQVVLLFKWTDSRNEPDVIALSGVNRFGTIGPPALVRWEN